VIVLLASHETERPSASVRRRRGTRPPGWCGAVIENGSACNASQPMDGWVQLAANGRQDLTTAATVKGAVSRLVPLQRTRPGSGITRR